MRALLERLGGIVIAPRSVVDGLLAGGRGGFNDLFLLLLLQACALRMPQLARLGWYALDTNLARGGLLLVNALAQALMVPLILAFAGGVVLRVAGGRAAWNKRTTDVSSLCLVPSVALQLAMSAAALLFPVWLYRPLVERAVQLVGGAWFVALLLLAISRLKRGASLEARA